MGLGYTSGGRFQEKKKADGRGGAGLQDATASGLPLLAWSLNRRRTKDGLIVVKGELVFRSSVGCREKERRFWPR